jgi:hypothetical protein
MWRSQSANSSVNVASVRLGMVSSLLGSDALGSDAYQPSNVDGPQQPVLLNDARKLRTRACCAALIVGCALAFYGLLTLTT